MQTQLPILKNYSFTKTRLDDFDNFKINISFSAVSKFVECFAGQLQSVQIFFQHLVQLRKHSTSFLSAMPLSFLKEKRDIII